MEGPVCTHYSYPLCSSSRRKTGCSSGQKVQSTLTGMHHYTITLAYNKIPQQILPNTLVQSDYLKIQKQCFWNEKACCTRFWGFVTGKVSSYICELSWLLMEGLVLVFHPSIWGSPRRAPQCTHHEIIILGCRMAWLCQTKNAHWYHDRTLRHAHKRVWSTHEAILQLHLFWIQNKGASLWGCSL